MIPPGASAAKGTKPAALPTAPGVNTGGSFCDPRAPVICRVPAMRNCGFAASILSDTADWEASRVCQVPCQVPSLSGKSESGRSPLEKLTVTDPELCGDPQSSRTSM